ncbi:hypothetical protein [Pedobacter faecalis]|uniref:hypothetical protein n=1 Tax=Pedobacter faecalis TaxID=3041495 RepID=UPI0025517EDD|nr:hypothetical protein [Pedobacter sp. ELA7]
MHFQVISDDYYNRILSRIQKHIPEFHSLFSPEDGVYPVLGELGSFILDNFHNEVIISHSANFINEAFRDGKGDTEDTIVVQVYQKMYERTDFTNFRMLLSEKAGVIFDKYLELYNNKA